MTRQDDYHWKMDTPEQAQWLATHIPHRVRAAIARLPMEKLDSAGDRNYRSPVSDRAGPHLLAQADGDTGPYSRFNALPHRG
jgi:hypothetical protein